MVLALSFKTENSHHRTYEENTIPLSIGQATLSVYVADTGILREKGLGGRESLSEGYGMLFIFEKADFQSFWMKDMKFPIDIIWIDETKRVVFVKNKVSPASYPETFSPKVSAKYVLETPAGFSEKNRLKVGDMVYF